MRISWRATLEDICGVRFKTADEACGNEQVRNILLDSVQPACCDEGCEVEPDGECEHGCPSISIAMGLI